MPRPLTLPQMIQRLTHKLTAMEKTCERLNSELSNAESEARKVAFRSSQLPISGAILDLHVWRIWQYCRDNDSSLDSERYTTQIRNLVESATSDFQKRIDTLVTDNTSLVEELQAVKNDRRSLQKALAICDGKLKAQKDSSSGRRKTERPLTAVG